MVQALNALLLGAVERKLAGPNHGAQRPPPVGSPHGTFPTCIKGPPQESRASPSRPPSLAFLGKPSADGQKRSAQILPEGETRTKKGCRGVTTVSVLSP